MHSGAACKAAVSHTRCQGVFSFDFLPPATIFPFNLPLRTSRWRQSVQLAFDPSGIEMAGYTSIKRPAIAALVVLLAAVLYQTATLQRYAFRVFTLIQQSTCSVTTGWKRSIYHVTWLSLPCLHADRMFSYVAVTPTSIHLLPSIAV